MNKLLAVYNTCQIGNQGNVAYYIDSIRSLLEQDMAEDLHVVLSGCMMTHISKAQLIQYFGTNISWSFINESLPLSVTFNHTVRRCVRQFGPFEGYLYVDSGINFWNKPDAVRIMYDRFKSGPYGIVAAMPSNDDGRQWWDIRYSPEHDFVYPLGKTTNMHCQIFSHEFFDAYDGRILPDIFASDSSESIFTFMCAAIRTKMMMIAENKLKLLHVHSMDGASVGWRKKEFLFRQGGSTPESMAPIYAKGKALGFGYEECDPQHRWQHDPAMYDAEGYALKPELKEFIRDNCFVREFNYDYISHQFIPRNQSENGL